MCCVIVSFHRASTPYVGSLPYEQYSHRRFYAHHLAAISAAIAHADALSVFADVSHRSHLLSVGLA
jgi:hypothetical protein